MSKKRKKYLLQKTDAPPPPLPPSACLARQRSAERKQREKQQRENARLQKENNQTQQVQLQVETGSSTNTVALPPSLPLPVVKLVTPDAASQLIRNNERKKKLWTKLWCLEFLVWKVPRRDFVKLAVLCRAFQKRVDSDKIWEKLFFAEFGAGNKSKTTQALPWGAHAARQEMLAQAPLVSQRLQREVMMSTSWKARFLWTCAFQSRFDKKPLSPSFSSKFGIAVTLRLRPLPDWQQKQIRAGADVSDFSRFRPRMPGAMMVMSPFKGRKEFRYSHALPGFVRQHQVYACAMGPILSSALCGINSLVMAYGQTGSGKTYSMFAKPTDDSSANEGIVFRSIRTLMHLKDNDPACSYVFSIRYVEVYNNQIMDLLDDNKPVKLISKGSDFVAASVETTISSMECARNVIGQGLRCRRQSSTHSNSRSSRSHAILFLSVTQIKRVQRQREQKKKSTKKSEKNSKKEVVKRLRSVIQFVDLAGSERYKKSKAEGTQFEELKGINLSLSALGRCISCLTDGEKHIPYRDSKLTLLLKAGLGGGGCCSLLITCRSENDHTEESLCTLRFGQLAQSVESRAVQQENPKEDNLLDLDVKIFRLKAEIRGLELLWADVASNKNHPVFCRCEACSSRNGPTNSTPKKVTVKANAEAPETTTEAEAEDESRLPLHMPRYHRLQAKLNDLIIERQTLASVLL